jgi:Xaa-Pro aminopeptidase
VTEFDAVVMAGIPDTNASLYRRMRFGVGDPAALIAIENETVLILRDIEMARARKHARADVVACPADYAPAGGLSGDRETATAQAVAECLRRAGARRIAADRTLPLIYADFIQRAGIDVICDLDLGVTDRRAKDTEEIQWLREAQAVTESAVRMACERVARADAGEDGVLFHEGEPLTAEGMRRAIDNWLSERGYSDPGAIVACGPEGADCHNYGAGPLRTGQPVIIDIFPKCNATRYNGDCTRTVVHGAVPEELARMHQTVQAAKAAAIATIRAGVTGEDVHRVTCAAVEEAGYAMGLPAEDAPASFCSMPHGTGHGVGLEVHEPPLLDLKGPALVAGDVVTVEPGLYTKSIGGVRLEDILVVTETGCENLNKLPEELDWR